MQLRHRRLAVGYRDCHRAPVHALHCATFGAAAGEVDDQPVAGLGLGVAIEGNHPPRHRRDPSAHFPASQQRIRHRDDMARQRDHAFHAGLERDGAVLVVAEDRPLATALGLGSTGAANGAQLSRPVAIAALQIQVSERNDVGVVVVRRVVVADQRPGVTGLRRCTAIGELAVDHVRPSEHIVEVLRARHVRLHHQLALRPVRHAPVNRRDVA